jgi:hypothetical protein
MSSRIFSTTSSMVEMRRCSGYRLNS